MLIGCPPNDQQFKLPFWQLLDGLRDPDEVERELAEKAKEKEAKRSKKKVKTSLETAIADAEAHAA